MDLDYCICRWLPRVNSHTKGLNLKHLGQDFIIGYHIYHNSHICIQYKIVYHQLASVPLPISNWSALALRSLTTVRHSCVLSKLHWLV